MKDELDAYQKERPGLAINREKWEEEREAFALQ